MKENTFHLVSLGCAKNTVDSDSMAQLLLQDGFSASEDPSLADVLIVNTCGFIGPSRDESIDVLKELAEEKEEGQLLIAAGCLTQRFSELVAEKVPGVDGEIVFEGRVQSGGDFFYEGEEQVEILAGNAAALRVTYNQRDLGLLGSFGEVVSRIYAVEGILTPTITPTPTIAETPRTTPSPTMTPSPIPTNVLLED